MEETREEKKKTTIPTFVVTFWLDSDKKKTWMPIPGDGT
jgi:hypothetical protein